MESVVNWQVVNHLERNCLLSQRQFGFRQGLGTSDLLTALHHQWSSTVSQGGSVEVLAVDMLVLLTGCLTWSCRQAQGLGNNWTPFGVD